LAVGSKRSSSSRMCCCFTLTHRTGQHLGLATASCSRGMVPVVAAAAPNKART
jgi:hypothetical protein